MRTFRLPARFILASSLTTASTAVAVSCSSGGDATRSSDVAGDAGGGAPGDAATTDGGAGGGIATTDGGAELLRAPELLGRPTATSIALGVVPAEALDVHVAFGEGTALDRTTPTETHTGTDPFTLTIDGLAPDTAYAYRLRWRRPGEGAFHEGERRTFHTARPRGATFRFTLQSDSHLDENAVLDVYKRTLGNVLTDAPDFHVDLGDTFMCEKHAAPFDATVMMAPDQATVDARYLYERGNFGLVTHSVPLFLVNGNHEGELGFLWKGAGNDIAAWATLARERFYLNPTPDGFYTGDSQAQPIVGERAAWYAWEWGDALFVALDPFWNTKSKSNSDGWVWTLGEAQYRWLEQTLAGSQAKYRFVFLHNLVGGLDGQMRGGVEAAPFFEWGGKNADGSDGFAQRRPGWSKPIHQLLVDGRVTAVFHGHDHLYAKQDLDGIVYQEVPQPSAKNTMNGAMLAQSYHYAAGTILSSAGHVRVTVAPSGVTAEYVRSWLPTQESAQRKNAEIAHSWTVTK